MVEKLNPFGRLRGRSTELSRSLVLSKSKDKNQLIPLTVGVSIFSLLFILSVFAWTGPPAVPPDPNAPAPINTSTTDQVKEGKLGIATTALDSSYGLTVGTGSNQLGIKTSGDVWIEGALTGIKPTGVSCTNNQVLKYDSANSNWICADDVSDSGSQWIVYNSDNTWTPRASGLDWSSVAMSSDGQNQTVTEFGGGNIWISSDYGNTWTPRASILDWNDIAMSSDAQYQTGTASGYVNIYTSSDYGNTWVAKASGLNWMAIAMSSDGRYQTATVWNGNIWISSDYGNTWVSRASSRGWVEVAMSSDGNYQTAVIDGGNIWISSDYGNTWASRASGLDWSNIAMSSDGRYQTGVVQNGNIYISSDYGNTWASRASSVWWSGVAMSSDGKYQTATRFNGNIYISSDYGNTWASEASSLQWTAVAMSSDGRYQTATARYGNIYTSYASSITYTYSDVGIGTMTPSYELDISGQANATELCIAGDCKLSWGSVTGIQGGGTTNYLSKFTGPGTIGNSQIFDDGSNVGIGTASPGIYKLNVNGNTILNGNFYRTAHSNGYFVGSYNNVGANSVRTNPIYTIGSNYMPDDAALSNMYGMGYTHTNASFITDPGPNSWGMYVAADGDARIFLAASSGGSSYFNAGNVGIGTTAPAYKLDVNGDLRVRGQDIYSAGGPPGHLRLNAVNGGYVEVKPAGVTYGLIIRDYNSSNWANIDANIGYLAIGYNNTDGPLYITDDDRVGIGTSNPSQKLSIAGGNIDANDGYFYGRMECRNLIIDSRGLFQGDPEGYCLEANFLGNDWFPISVSCANPGNPPSVMDCGPSSGDDTCYWQEMSTNLWTICDESAGGDAMITCCRDNI